MTSPDINLRSPGLGFGVSMRAFPVSARLRQVFLVLGELAERAVRVDHLRAAHDVHGPLEAHELVGAREHGRTGRDVRHLAALFFGGQYHVRLVGQPQDVARLVVAEIDAAAAHAAALERDGPWSAHDPLALTVRGAVPFRLEPIARGNHDVPLHVEIRLVLTDSRFVAGRHEGLAMTNRRHFCVDETDAAVGIGVLLLGLDANRLFLALHLHQERAGAFNRRRRIATFDGRGGRRLFAPARREEDDGDDADGDDQHEQARALLPADHVPSLGAAVRTSLTDNSRYSFPWYLLCSSENAKSNDARLSVMNCSRSTARQAIARKMRPFCFNAIFKCFSFSRRGPSTTSTPRASNNGRGLPVPNGASIAISPAKSPLMSRKPRHPSMRRRGFRSSGPNRLSA